MNINDNILVLTPNNIIYFAKIQFILDEELVVSTKYCLDIQNTSIIEEQKRLYIYKSDVLKNCKTNDFQQIHPEYFI